MIKDLGVRFSLTTWSVTVILTNSPIMMEEMRRTAVYLKYVNEQEG